MHRLRDNFSKSYQYVTGTRRWAKPAGDLKRVAEFALIGLP